MLSKQFCKAPFHKLTPEQRVIALGNMLVEELMAMEHPLITKATIIPVNIGVQVFQHSAEKMYVGNLAKSIITGVSTPAIQDFVNNWVDPEKKEEE